MCFILCMFCVRSLYRSFRDSSLFSCGNIVVVWDFHSNSSSVACSWKFASMLLRWAPPSFFIRNIVRVVGDLLQLWYLILCMSCAPPYFARIYCMSLL